MSGLLSTSSSPSDDWAIPGIDPDSSDMATMNVLLRQLNEAESEADREAIEAALRAERKRLTRVAQNRARIKRHNFGNASLFSLALQLWSTPLVNLASEHTVKETDLVVGVPESNRTDLVSSVFRSSWRDQVASAAAAATRGLKSLPSIKFAMYHAQPYYFFAVLACDFMDAVFIFTSPYIIKAITQFFEASSAGEETSAGMGILWISLLTLSAIGSTFAYDCKVHHAMQMGVRARCSMLMAVYEKTLTIAPSARTGISTGYIMNLMSSDATRCLYTPFIMHHIWFDPLQILVALLLLYVHLGPTAFVAIGIMLLLFPILILSAHLLVKANVAAKAEKDKRVKLVNEMLQGVRVIKLYAWEDAVRKAIDEVRAKELKYFRRVLILNAASSALLFLWPALVTYLTVLTYAETNGDTLTSGKVFMVLSFLNVLHYPIMLLPYAIEELTSFSVSVNRVRDFLAKPDMISRPLLPAAVSPGAPVSSTGAGNIEGSEHAGNAVALSAGLEASHRLIPAFAERFSIAARHASFSWLSPSADATVDDDAGDSKGSKKKAATVSSDDGDGGAEGTDINALGGSADVSASTKGSVLPVLADINLAVPPGSLAAIVGPVGVGKSSLLLGLLGEMHLVPTPPADEGGPVGTMPRGLTSEEEGLWAAAPAFVPPPGGIAAAAGEPLDLGVRGDDDDAAAMDAVGIAETGRHGSDDVSEAPLSLDTGLPLPASFAQLPPTKFTQDVTNDAAHALELACLRGRVGYLSQDPWIINGSVRANITLGLPFHRARFDAAVAAAALTTDLEILQNGEKTMIGEQGVNLSGGQRARVAMARLVYRADLIDVCLIDDPLSAVDMGVGRHIFEQCIMGVLKNKTRLLCLNSHLHILKHADTVIVVGPRGTVSPAPSPTASSTAADREESESTQRPPSTILAQGSYAELKASNIDFSAFEHAHEPSHDSEESPAASAASEGQVVRVIADSPASDVHDDADDPFVNEDNKARSTHGKKTAVAIDKSAQDIAAAEALLLSTAANGKASEAAAETIFSPTVAAAAAADAADAEKKAGTDSEDGKEKLDSGAVSGRTYWTYFKGGSRAYIAAVRLAIIIIATAFAQFLRQFFDWWMVEWANDSPSGPSSKHNLGWWEVSTVVILSLYVAALVIASVFLISLNMDASRSLHGNNFSRLLRAPMSWFDTTPMGQVLNRFSKDMGEVDSIIPEEVLTAVQQTLIAVGIAVLACLSTPLVIAPFAVILLGMYLSQRVFRPAATAIKRVESRTFSPVYSSFSAAAAGAATLRAFGLTSNFARKHIGLLDINSHVTCLNRMLQRWLAFRLDMLSNACIFAVGVLCVLLRHRVNATIAGLAVLYSYQLTGLVQWTVRTYISLETNMTSVERIEQYKDLPQEPEYRTPRPALESIKAAAVTHAPNPALVAGAGLSRDLYGWPWAGKVRFHRVTLRYRPDLPIVVNELSFDVPAGSKVGVVGRTGAGKSTILLSLFRMMGIEAGRIEIDGVDTRTVGLGDLRARISIIPQQPVLFSGTVRYNLDPFGEHSEQALWQALERVQMSTAVHALEGELEAPVEEQGGNFSQGQRQLLCIARALLRQNKIIVLDEATAAVDLATDAAIQTAIRECFADCTVITIAHRLETIADYDYVLVLGPTDAEAAEASHARRMAARNGAADDAEGSRAESGAPLSLLEFDTPLTLLENCDSALFRMASQGGSAVLANLTNKAREASLKTR